MDEIKDIKTQALDELVEKLGISTLPEDKRNEMLIKMTEVLLKRIFIETMEKLGEQGRDEYAEIMQKNPDPDELESFFAERIRDYDELVQKVIMDFKAEMLEAK